MNQTEYRAKTPDASGWIDYSAQEHHTWQLLYQRQQQNLPGRACAPYFDGLAALALSGERIPQLAEIDRVLQASTGWRTEPVPALISFGRFFALLAEQAFPVATFIRRPQQMDYLQEPDIFHEIFGHCPLLTNPAFARFSHIYGQLGLAASKEERVFLARLYWFTVEFGLVKTAEGLRIYGGGILSSPGETLYALSGAPDVRPFDLLDVLRTPYRIDVMQPIYYVIDSIDFLDQIASMNIMQAIRTAKEKGLFAPAYAV